VGSFGVRAEPTTCRSYSWREHFKRGEIQSWHERCTDRPYQEIPTVRFTSIALVLPLLLTACPRNRGANDEPLSQQEAQLALEEASAASGAEALMAANVEFTTNFTIGEAVREAAEELRDFIRTQLPCADVALHDATLSIEYGVNGGNCQYRGQTFSGGSSVRVERNSDDQVIVHHEWTDLSNGVVMLNGTADVTWDFAAKERHVVHQSEWTHLASGRTGVGEGDRVQRALEGGVVEGISVDGSRSWTGSAGHWDLAIEGVEMRWSDPVPQAGSYTLVTPKDKALSLSFERVDEDTIAVTVAGPKRSFTFDVSKPD
jgi:hypothetical protein